MAGPRFACKALRRGLGASGLRRHPTGTRSCLYTCSVQGSKAAAEAATVVAAASSAAGANCEIQPARAAEGRPLAAAAATAAAAEATAAARNLAFQALRNRRRHYGSYRLLHVAVTPPAAAAAAPTPAAAAAAAAANANAAGSAAGAAAAPGLFFELAASQRQQLLPLLSALQQAQPPRRLLQLLQQLAAQGPAAWQHFVESTSLQLCRLILVTRPNQQQRQQQQQGGAVSSLQQHGEGRLPARASGVSTATAAAATASAAAATGLSYERFLIRFGVDAAAVEALAASFERETDLLQLLQLVLQLPCAENLSSPPSLSSSFTVQTLSGVATAAAGSAAATAARAAAAAGGQEGPQEVCVSLSSSLPLLLAAVHPLRPLPHLPGLSPLQHRLPHAAPVLASIKAAAQAPQGGTPTRFMGGPVLQWLEDLLAQQETHSLLLRLAAALSKSIAAPQPKRKHLLLPLLPLLLLLLIDCCCCCFSCCCCSAAFPLLELQARAALHACLDHKQQQQQQQQLGAAATASLARTLQQLSAREFHLLLPSVEAVAALHLTNHLRDSLWSVSPNLLLLLLLLLLCCCCSCCCCSCAVAAAAVAAAVDAALAGVAASDRPAVLLSPCCSGGLSSRDFGLSLLLMQRALEALRLRAEPLGVEEACLLLRGVRSLEAAAAAAAAEEASGLLLLLLLRKGAAFSFLFTKHQLCLRLLQTQLSPQLHGTLTLNLPLLQLQLWPFIRLSLRSLPPDLLLQVFEVYIHSSFLVALLESDALRMQTLPYRRCMQPQCASLEPWGDDEDISLCVVGACLSDAAFLSLRSPLLEDLLEAAKASISRMELHHVARLCQSLVPFIELCRSIRPAKTLKGEESLHGLFPTGAAAADAAAGAAPFGSPLPTAAAAATTTTTKSSCSIPALQLLGSLQGVQAAPQVSPVEAWRDSLHALARFVSHLLTTYFGASNPSKGSSSSSSRSSSYGESTERMQLQAPTPQELLAGRFALHALTTPDFVNLVKVFTACGHRDGRLEPLLLQETATRLETPLPASAVAALLQLPTPEMPSPALVRGFDQQLRRLSETSTDLQVLLDLSAALRQGWRASLVSRFHLQHHVERLATACRPEPAAAAAAAETPETEETPLLLLRHVPGLLSFAARQAESSTPVAVSSPTSSAAAAAAVLSLALRVLVPALHARQLLPRDLQALLQPLADLKPLKSYVAAAKETAPQSALALLPAAVERAILLSLETPSEDVLHLPPLLRLAKQLGLDAAVYIHPMLSALQRSSLRSLHWTQWQQQKYGNGEGLKEEAQEGQEQQQQQQLEGGLSDETEVELLHCLLMAQHFTHGVTSCFRRCLLHTRDQTQEARVLGSSPAHDPSVFLRLYEAFLALQHLAPPPLMLHSPEDSTLITFCQRDLPQAFWASLHAAQVPCVQPLLTSWGFCHFAAAAKRPLAHEEGAVAGLAVVCIPEEETIPLSQQEGEPLLLLHQQQLRRCSGRSKLLLQLLEKARWAVLPIWLEQPTSRADLLRAAAHAKEAPACGSCCFWQQLPDEAARVAYLRALTGGDDS
ncbi:hypothetical protein Emed_002579 [Eimeria media]